MEGAGVPPRTPEDHEASKAAFIKAIYGQESSSGAADTSKPNYAGAIGPMQVTKDTFDGMKANGQIPKHADFYNPNHTKRAGEILAGYLFDKYGGNPALAAAAYYGGEKAVSNGKIVSYRDLKNSNAPDTRQYAKDILRRMGLT